MSRTVRPDFRTSSWLKLDAGPVLVQSSEPGAPKALVDGLPANVQSEVDSYSTRIIKYIPAEVIALYSATDKLIQSQNQTTSGSKANDFFSGLISAHAWGFSLGVFLLSLVAVPVYYWATSDTNQRVTVNIVIAIIGFVVWTYSIDGSVFKVNSNLDFYNETIAGLATIFFTFFAGFIVPGVGSKPEQVAPLVSPSLAIR